jgi:hypothetical protein
MMGLFFLYLGIFVILVTIQFTKQRGFTRRIGPMSISGHYGEFPVQMADIGNDTVSGSYPLEGGLIVSFGGMEFRLRNDKEFGLLRSGGDKDAILPQTMNVSGSSAVFNFVDGTQLVFDIFDAGTDRSELRITSLFGEEYEGIELPYRPLRTSRIRDTGNGQFAVMTEGIHYSFNLSRLDGSRKVLILNTAEPIAIYRAIPARQEFAPEKFVLSSVKDEFQYNTAVNRWRDEAYALWSRAVRNTRDESLVMAFAGESVNRGAYQEAIAEIFPAFIREASWTYGASVYLGRLGQGLRTLSVSEADALTRLSALVAAKSGALFLEPHVINFYGIRGYDHLLDGAAALAHSLDPAALSADMVPGILEAHAEWKTYRPQGGNPFEGLIENVYRIIAEGIKSPAAFHGVLYFQDTLADTEYNLRLGLALDQYGRQPGRDVWGALGRSLVASVLSLTENGSIPKTLSLSGPGGTEGGSEIRDTVVPASSDRIDSLALYRWFPGAAYPHAVSIGAPVNGVWAWTASASVTASRENNILDIAASFPLGGTHYMLIRGLRPFVKIQLYDIDYRTDPQFERYDSSGWVYSASEQTLLLKLKHRSPVEHIRVFY